MREKSFWENWL